MKLIEKWQKATEQNGQCINKVFVPHEKFTFHLHTKFVDQANTYGNFFVIFYY